MCHDMLQYMDIKTQPTMSAQPDISEDNVSTKPSCQDLYQTSPTCTNHPGSATPVNPTQAGSMKNVIPSNFVEGVTKCGCGMTIRKILWLKKTRTKNKKGQYVSKNIKKETWRCMSCSKVHLEPPELNVNAELTYTRGGGGFEKKIILTPCEPKPRSDVDNSLAPIQTKRRREHQ